MFFLSGSNDLEGKRIANMIDHRCGRQCVVCLRDCLIWSYDRVGRLVLLSSPVSRSRLRHREVRQLLSGHTARKWGMVSGFGLTFHCSLDPYVSSGYILPDTFQRQWRLNVAVYEQHVVCGNYCQL